MLGRYPFLGLLLDPRGERRHHSGQFLQHLPRVLAFDADRYQRGVDLQSPATGAVGGLFDVRRSLGAFALRQRPVIDSQIVDQRGRLRCIIRQGPKQPGKPCLTERPMRGGDRATVRVGRPGRVGIGIAVEVDARAEQTFRGGIIAEQRQHPRLERGAGTIQGPIGGKAVTTRTRGIQMQQRRAAMTEGAGQRRRQMPRRGDAALGDVGVATRDREQPQVDAAVIEPGGRQSSSAIGAPPQTQPQIQIRQQQHAQRQVRAEQPVQLRQPNAAQARPGAANQTAAAGAIADQQQRRAARQFPVVEIAPGQPVQVGPEPAGVRGTVQFQTRLAQQDQIAGSLAQLALKQTRRQLSAVAAPIQHHRLGVGIVREGAGPADRGAGGQHDAEAGPTEPMIALPQAPGPIAEVPRQVHQPAQPGGVDRAIDACR